MSGTRYAQLTDGDVVVIPLNGWYKIACCHCGLVHSLRIKAFAVPGRKRPRIAFTAHQDKRATAAMRRHNTYVARVK